MMHQDSLEPAAIRNLLFNTTKTKKKSMVFKIQVVTNTKVALYTWMPPVYKTKSTWPDKKWKLKA